MEPDTPGVSIGLPSSGGSPDPRTLTFTAMLSDRACRSGEKVFRRYLPDGRSYTYAQLNTVSNRIANNALALGVEPGSHVGVMMENCPEQVLAYFGLAKAGAVSVPINTAARGDLLAYFLSHADCRSLIVDEHLLQRVMEVCDRLELLERIFILRTADARLASDTDDSHGTEVHDFAVLLTPGAEQPPPAPSYSDLAFLMYTSGTTGPSKAIMFTQAHTLYWGWDYGWHHQYDKSDVVYVYLPLFHGNAWLCATLGAFMSGASVALARRFSASRFWDDVAASGATVTNCLGAVVSFLWNQEPSPKEREHQLVRMGVTPVPEFGHQLEERFGVRIMSSYGLTDYCSVAIPRYVEFVESLPINLSLKVEKYILRARAESRLGELWDREQSGIQLER